MRPAQPEPTRPLPSWRAPRLLAAAAVVIPSILIGAVPAHAHGGAVGGHGATYMFQDSPVGPTSMLYGRAWDDVVIGDWDGDGIDTPAVRRGRTYFVTSGFTGGVADHVFDYGRVDDVVLVGDWNGDGKDTLAVRRGNTYYVKDSLLGGPADAVVDYGSPTDIAVVGDWNGDGKDTLAVRRKAEFHLSNRLGGATDRVLWVGGGTDRPLSGDWDGDGRDDVGVRKGTVIQTLTQKNVRASQDWGLITDHPFAGDWDGDGKDSVALRRPEANAWPSNQDVVIDAEMVLRAARSRIGSEYVFAGGGPRQFDCSGLTTWAFRFVGIELPRYSGGQPSKGREVSAREAQPGDLVWWPGHVAVYAGNGMMIDAANPDMGILERPLMSNPTFYRLLGQN